MKILFLTSRFPYPAIKGDQVVVYNRLRYLSKFHEITLVCLYQKEQELTALEYIKSYCAAVHVVKLSKYQSIVNVLKKAAFSNIPLQVLYYLSADFKEQVKKLLAENDFDLIHAYLIRTAEYIEQSHLPKVLDLIDSMQLNIVQRMALASPLKRLLYREEWRRIKQYERWIGNKFNHMMVVAQKDKEFLADENLSVIPLGVNTDAYFPIIDTEKKYTLIFSGNMSYAPNINAVTWFVDHCFPEIQRKIDNVTFVIAGSSPAAKIQELSKRKGIVVTGFVDSMPQALNEAHIAIAPMQSASGMQNKILEAMACGLPVITTSLGLGSIKARQGQNIIVADTPERFIQKVLMLVADAVQAKKIGTQARNYVMDKHSWDHSNQLVEDIYRQVVDDVHSGDHGDQILRPVE
jgi:sugar transferase (PEP-CTERM/EpsH1 system associated)